MPRTAIYLGARNTKAKHYKLPLNRRLSHYPDGPFITEKICAQLTRRGRIFEVAERGIVLRNEEQIPQKVAIPPFIFVRSSLKTAIGAFRVFIAQSEINALAKHFDVPSKVLANSFFVRPKGERTYQTSRELHVKPSWSELLDPKWKKAFLDWIAGRGPMPMPSELEWETFSRDSLSFPALRPLVSFKGVRGKKIKGTHVLEEINGKAYASFCYSDKRVSTYLLGPDKIKKVGQTY